MLRVRCARRRMRPRPDLAVGSMSRPASATSSVTMYERAASRLGASTASTGDGTTAAARSATSRAVLVAARRRIEAAGGRPRELVTLSPLAVPEHVKGIRVGAEPDRRPIVEARDRGARAVGCSGRKRPEGPPTDSEQYRQAAPRTPAHRARWARSSPYHPFVTGDWPRWTTAGRAARHAIASRMPEAADAGRREVFRHGSARRTARADLRGSQRPLHRLGHRQGLARGGRRRRVLVGRGAARAARAAARGVDRLDVHRALRRPEGRGHRARSSARGRSARAVSTSSSTPSRSRSARSSKASSSGPRARASCSRMTSRPTRSWRWPARRAR